MKKIQLSNRIEKPVHAFWLSESAFVLIEICANMGMIKADDLNKQTKTKNNSIKLRFVSKRLDLSIQ